ncbi:MAG: amidohydrolase family protein [Hymenobacter sp.]|nr:amidohydrolase family protein [Hymenobacter sp.]
MPPFLQRASILLFIGLTWGRWGFSQKADVLAIVGAHVLPLTGPQVIQNQTVLIKDGIIQQIGPLSKVVVPKGATVVNGKGHYLMPGLADMHAHLPGAEGTQHRLDDYLRLNLACGVTSLRSMRGDPAHLRLRDSLRRTGVLSPRLYLGTPVLTRDKSFTARKGQQLLRTYQASGYDFVKYLGGLTPAVYDSVLEQAHELGFRVAGHAPASGLSGAIAHHQASIEHVEAFIAAYRQDWAQFERHAQQMAHDTLFTCPDLFWYQAAWLQVLPAQLEQLPGLAYVAPAIRAQWAAGQLTTRAELTGQNELSAKVAEGAAALAVYRQALRKMQRAGVPLLISPGDGAYVVPGYGMAEELKLFVAAGLTPYQALRAATYNAAWFFGEQNRRGTLEVGKQADLVLLEDNPLTDIRNISRVTGVAVNGKWRTAAELRAGLSTR